MRCGQFIIFALLALCSKPIIAGPEQDMEKCQISGDFNNFIDLLRPKVIESVKSAINVTLSSSIDSIITKSVSDIRFLVDTNSLYINKYKAEAVLDKYFSGDLYGQSVLNRDHIDSIAKTVENHIVSLIEERGFTQLITLRTIRFDLEKIFSEFDFQSYAEDVTADLFVSQHIKELVYGAIRQQNCTDDVKHFLIDTKNIDITTEILTRLEKPTKLGEFLSLSLKEFVRMFTMDKSRQRNTPIHFAIGKLLSDDSSYIQRSFGTVVPCLLDIMNEQILDKVVRKWIYGVERKVEKNADDDECITDALTEEIEGKSVKDIMNKQFQVSQFKKVFENTVFITLNRTAQSYELSRSLIFWKDLFEYIRNETTNIHVPGPMFVYQRYVSSLHKLPIEEFVRMSVDKFLTEGRLYSIVSSVLKDSLVSGLLSQESFEKIDSTILKQENNLTEILKETLNEFHYDTMVYNSMFNSIISYNEFLPISQDVKEDLIWKRTTEPEVLDFRYSMDFDYPPYSMFDYAMMAHATFMYQSRILDYGHDLLFNITQENNNEFDELEEEVMSMTGVSSVSPEFARVSIKQFSYNLFFHYYKITSYFNGFAKFYADVLDRQYMVVFRAVLSYFTENFTIDSLFPRVKREITSIPVDTNNAISIPMTPEAKKIIDSFTQIEPKDISTVKKISLVAKKIFGKIVLKLNKIFLFMKKSGKKLDKFLSKFSPYRSLSNNLQFVWEGGIQKYFLETLGGLDFVIEEKLEQIDLQNLSLAKLEEVFEWPVGEDGLGFIERWGQEFDTMLDYMVYSIEYYEINTLNFVRKQFGWMDILGVLDFFE